MHREHARDQALMGLDSRLFLFQDQSLGLVANEDPWWQSNERESDEGLHVRAENFLERVYRGSFEEVMIVVSHSGFIGALLSAIGREEYSATNAELIPVLVRAKEARPTEEL